MSGLAVEAGVLEVEGLRWRRRREADNGLLALHSSFSMGCGGASGWYGHICRISQCCVPMFVGVEVL